MLVRDNESLKGVAHGLLLGVTLPVLAYNLDRKNWRNVLIYSVFGLFEVYQIGRHVSADVQVRGRAFH